MEIPPVVIPAPVKRGVCINEHHCFVLKAPPVKAQKENTLRTQYYINRMRMQVKKAQDPDMNMTLNEIKTGVKTSERAALSLAVYLLGVLAIFWNM